MSDKSRIEWTDATWNPITGCTPVSEGCEHCYAKRHAERFRGRFGYPAEDPFQVTFHEDRLEQPLRWKKPRKIFVC
jgi:protein gp37